LKLLETPAPIKEGALLCVQIGAFQDSREAATLKQKLASRYRTAKVLQFSRSVGGDWIPRTPSPKTIRSAHRK